MNTIGVVLMVFSSSTKDRRGEETEGNLPGSGFGPLSEGGRQLMKEAMRQAFTNNPRMESLNDSSFVAEDQWI